MSGTSTAVINPVEESLSSSRLLGSSLSSLSSPRKSSEVSRTYKQASTLFLTRRLAEAFATIQPLVTIPLPEEDSGELRAEDEEKTIPRAPIANASRSSRIKIWSFYLTLLNSIAELGLEDGKNTFGSKEWRSITAKARDGTIWDEVVRIGYGGNEGNVDADVVANLANLLLAQSPSQTSNQQRLKAYLSASSHPSLDLTGRFGSESTTNGHTNGRASHRSGTDTPRDLESRLKIIELYTIHVLPRNGEWEYARDFINMSEVLDEERREEFLHTLRSLEEEQSEQNDQLEEALPQPEEDVGSEGQLVQSTSTDSASTIKESQMSNHHRSDREKDYGIESTSVAPKAPMPKPPALKPVSKPSQGLQPRSTRPSSHTASRKSATPGVDNRSLKILSSLQHLISNMTQHMSKNPIALLRFLLFVMALAVAFGRRDVKDRLSRLTGVGWDKIRKTVGMGIKVSYI